MTVTIEIPEDLEAALRERSGCDRDDLSQAVLELVKQGLSMNAPLASEQVSVDEWLQRFRKWVATRPTYGVVPDDSRESIYAGRGE